MHKVTLYLPGLLSFSPHDLYEDFTAPVNLTHVLGFSRHQKQTPLSFLQQLAQLFGLEKKTEQDYPVAALTRLIDDASRPEGVWMRADPVYLSTDAHGMTLFDASQLQLDQQEALALGARLQSLFNEHDYQLEVPVADRWYVSLPYQPEFETTDLYSVRGQSILSAMPTGKDAHDWIQLANEVQMLLHECDVNQSRIQQGKQAVNSLWFWGCGCLPDVLPRNWSAVYADSALVRGLCMLSGTPVSTTSQYFSDLLNHDNSTTSEILIVLDRAEAAQAYQDLTAWHDYLQMIENLWMKSMLQHMQAGKIKQLTIRTNTCQYEYVSHHKMKFWNHFRRFEEHLRVS